ncbi:hypothetical protein PIB30_006477 [Stylosanthes scabra]|uniref:ribonuclease P n=1 Tax=Stylosanthes scabra TaxID=79078 RepID=A0ABU6V6E5_9FABA|nr:hypothetical protein [Stylosanthes scabra]
MATFNTLQLQHLLSLFLSSSSSSSSSFPHRNHFQLTPRASSHHPHETSPKTISFKQTQQHHQTATGYSSVKSLVETPTRNSVKTDPHTRFNRSTHGYRDRTTSSSSSSSGRPAVTERFQKKEKEKLVNKTELEKENKKKRKKKKDQDSPELKLRVALDMCSKRGDVMEALSLYDSALAKGLKLGQHHYTVLLYLCSSAAVGVVRPAKSGTGSRTLNALLSSTSEAVDSHEANDSADPFASEESSFVKEGSSPSRQEDHGIMVSEDVKKYALQRGFEIYASMCSDKVQLNEAALTSVARMAMSMGDGDRAFEMVKQMKIIGINPRLRSYGPALSTYCSNGEIDKAFDVEKHMLENGVYPEEPELEALLRVSVQAGKGDKTTIGDDGICKCCGVHLATIDLDPIETENFAKSVASIAVMREKKLNFQKFQAWLDYHGPFEAVVDAANVGLFRQRKFKPSMVNAVVNGIRQKLPSGKFPLIILHHRRIKGEKMGEPINRALIDRWNNADALYATPTGSNDDWYWLYAAIKFKCLLVTNDEMRDHLFQLLGNDFFPKWKERHQVRFSFSDSGPQFHMPPPCSVVIQESEQGHWHVPIETEVNYESERRWLCITRPTLGTVCEDSSTATGNN